MREELQWLRKDKERLEAAIRWALGEGGSDFADCIQPGNVRYWWRSHLSKRAGLEAK